MADDPAGGGALSRRDARTVALLVALVLAAIMAAG
jgi:hypothetical protein